jgi:hypothetical protein
MSESIFAPFKLNEAGGKKAARVQQLFEALTQELESILAEGVNSADVSPNVREVALVRTKLQEASFFVVRGLAMLPVNQSA